MTKNQSTRVVLISAAAIIASVLLANAQSLGELARQEAARRKDVKAPVKVFTNDNIRVIPPAAPPVAQAEPGGPPARLPRLKRPREAAGGAGPHEDPEFWRKRMRDALQPVTQRLPAGGRPEPHQRAHDDFYARDDPYQRAQIEVERNKTLAEFERMKKQQLELEKAIEDIEEEARRANVPPGWLR